MASEKDKRKLWLALAGAEAAAVAFVGVGFALSFRDVGIGLIAAGLLMWINLTIGGLRRKR